MRHPLYPGDSFCKALASAIATGIVLLLLASLTSVTRAQVVIRDSVDLSLPPGNGGAGIHPEQGGFYVNLEIEEDGELQLANDWLWRVAPLFPPGQPRLKAYRDGVLFFDDYAFDHDWVGPTLVGLTYCQGDQTYEWDPVGWPSQTWYSLGEVQEGEVISFLWLTDLDVYGDDPEEGYVDDYWEYIFFINHCGCCSSGGEENHIEKFLAYYRVVPCSESSTLCGQTVSFIDHSNNPVPTSGDDAALMVSQFVTNVSLPSTPRTFDGPVPSPADERTYRMQSGPITDTNPTVVFQLEHSRGGTVIGTYQYEAVSGTVGSDTVSLN